MPLIEIRQLSPQVRLGLWRMEMGAKGASSPFGEVEKVSPRQRERQAVKALLAAMTDDDTQVIGHEESGKPFIENSNLLVSVSHTKGYAVLMLSTESEVGVDIEQRTDRVVDIASRFIRPDEPANTVDEMLLLWSAKETIYKLFSSDHLYFFDMRMLSYGDGIIKIENIKRKKVVDVCYEFTDDYVLTYAFTTPAHSVPQLCTTASD